MLSYFLVSLLALFSLGHAHGIMIEPYPYNYAAQPLYQNWPLSADLPFPCQNRTQHIEKDRAVINAGTNQTVKFWVSAVHGGGSCQFSIAYGYPPPQNASAWKTLYTIIGGCPAQAVGNLPTVETDANGRANGRQCGNSTGDECVRQFDIPIPQGLPNGNATFAWTWLNRIGDREYYMSCSHVTITGGTNDGDFMESLPPVFQANMPGKCTTGESGLLVNIPDPGQYGVVYDEPSAGANGDCPTAASPSFQTGPRTSGTAIESHRTSFVTVTMTTASASRLPGSTNAGTTGHGSHAASTASPSTTRGTSSTGAPAAGEVRCTAGDGQVECFGKSRFGICNEGWAVPQSLNANHVCSDGAITYQAS